MVMMMMMIQRSWYICIVNTIKGGEKVLLDPAELVFLLDDMLLKLKFSFSATKKLPFRKVQTETRVNMHILEKFMSWNKTKKTQSCFILAAALFISKPDLMFSVVFTGEQRCGDRLLAAKTEEHQIRCFLLRWTPACPLHTPGESSHGPDIPGKSIKFEKKSFSDLEKVLNLANVNARMLLKWTLDLQLKQHSAY